MSHNTKFGRLMLTAKQSTVNRRQFTSNTNIWYQLKEHNNIFTEFLRSQFATTYVDIKFYFY